MDGIKAETGSRAIKALETGGDFGRESKRAVQELKAVAGAEGIHLKPSVSRKVDVFKDSFVKTEKKVKSGFLSDERVTYYLNQSLNNNNSNTAILGSTGKYDVIGEAKGYTYFKMQDEIWAQLESEAMKNYDEIWKVNKLFIDEQVGAGKRILLSNDTYAGYYFNDGTRRFYQRELDYLKELGYSFKSIGDGLWEAIK